VTGYYRLAHSVLYEKDTVGLLPYDAEHLYVERGQARHQIVPTWIYRITCFFVCYIDIAQRMLR